MCVFIYLFVKAQGKQGRKLTPEEILNTHQIIHVLSYISPTPTPYISVEDLYD
jgi:hypothetical protein